MTPKTITGPVEVSKQVELPSRTYKIDWEHGRVVGMTDGQEAVQQTIQKILQTKRFSHLIYSWNYGVESDQLIGKSQQVIESELRRLLSEALTQDERITAVSDVEIVRTEKQSSIIRVTVETIFGTIRGEVSVYV